MKLKLKLGKNGRRIVLVVGVASILMFGAWMVRGGATVMTGVSYLVFGILCVGYWYMTKGQEKETRE